MSWLCRFWLHRWSLWKPTMGRLLDPPQREIGIYLEQTRTCEKCGLAELRTTTWINGAERSGP